MKWQRAKYGAERYIERNGRVWLQIALAFMVGYLIYTIVSLTETIKREQREHRAQAESTLRHLENIIEADKKNTEEHRRRNEEVHEEIKQYIRCIVLLPEEQRNDATELDNCAHMSIIPPESEPAEPDAEEQAQATDEPQAPPAEPEAEQPPPPPATLSEPPQPAEPQEPPPPPPPPPQSLFQRVLEQVMLIISGVWL